MKKVFYLQKQIGFSLIEMMIVVAILGIIILGLVTFFTGGTKSWVAGQSQLEAQRNARQAMDQMVREIRKGRNVKSSSDNDTIIVSIPAFDPETAYDVTYNLSGRTIQRGGTNNLINDVICFNLIYYNNNGHRLCDDDGNPINPLDSIAASKVSNIHIELKVDVDGDNNPDITLNTEVDLRNYGL